MSMMLLSMLAVMPAFLEEHTHHLAAATPPPVETREVATIDGGKKIMVRRPRMHRRPQASAQAIQYHTHSCTESHSKRILLWRGNWNMRQNVERMTRKTRELMITSHCASYCDERCPHYHYDGYVSNHSS